MVLLSLSGICKFHDELYELRFVLASDKGHFNFIENFCNADTSLSVVAAWSEQAK